MKPNWKLPLFIAVLFVVARIGWELGGPLSNGVKSYLAERPQRVAAAQQRRAEIRAHNAEHCFVTGTHVDAWSEGPEKTYGPVIEMRKAEAGRTHVELVYGAEIDLKISSIKDCKF